MKKEIIFGFIIALFLAIIISPFASPWPDGLERVAEDKGFIEKAECAQAVPAPIPDYGFPGIKNEKTKTALAGAAGTIIVFVAAFGIGYILKAKK